MTDIHILRPSKETDKDKLSITEAKKKLKPCPICGSKAYISKDIVDGFYFGWSVGCPRYCLNDGIHESDEQLSIHYLGSAEECVEKWNRKVDEFKTQRKDIKEILSKIKDDIGKYELDCRFADYSQTDECTICNKNVFGSIYSIIDKYIEGSESE